MVLLLLSTLFIGYVVWQFWRSLLEYFPMAYRCYFVFKKIPGPNALPLIGSAHYVNLDNIELSYTLEREARKAIMEDPQANGMASLWLGPVPVLFVIEPDYVKAVLESNNLITKAAFYEPLAKWIGTGLLISTNEKWFSRRKLISPTFHFNILKGYFEIFAKQGEILAQQLERDADTSLEFDVFPYIKKCAIDIICESAMGYQLNAQTGGSFEYVEGVVKLSDLVWDNIRFPWNWLPLIWYGTGVGFRFDRLVKKSNGFTIDIIKERRVALEEEGLLGENVSEEVVKKQKRLIFLDLLLMMQKANALTDEDIREEVDTFMFEGHDTTASGMGFAIWLIGQYPEYQQKIHDELDAVFGDSDREPTEADMKKLVWLEWSIKEALRLYPSVSLIARKLTEDLKLNEYVFPKNLSVAIAPVVSHRHPVFWEKPEEFYPEHFGPELAAKRHPYAYIPFSAGPRNCVGQKFAILEEKCVISWVFRKYRVETVEPMPGNRPVIALITKPPNGFAVKLFRRKRA